MTKVYGFPKKKLPKEIEDRVFEVAKAYVITLKEAAEDLCYDPWDEDELFEITELVLNAYAEGLEIAIDELE